MADLDEMDTTPMANEGAVMTVRSPADNSIAYNDDGVKKLGSEEWEKEPTPMTITLAGVDSERFKRANRKITTRRDMQQRGQRRPKPIPQEEQEADNTEVLAACTIAWNITVGTSKPEFTHAEAVKIYSRYPWLQEQVDTFVGDRANFVKASTN